MNPYQAYQQPSASGTTRIDLILGLYRVAIDRLERAQAALSKNDAAKAQQFRADAQLSITGLAGGLDLSQGEMNLNLLRLYEFVAECIEVGSSEMLDGALKVLRILQEGFEEIRPEALELERNGTIPSVDCVRLLHATA